MPAAATYVDLYLLPVVTSELDAYEQQATTFGQVARELGALSYREWAADDLGDSLRTADDTTLTFAVAEFTSREHRDDVMSRVMADPRVEALLQQPQPADMEQMRYGGFRALVTA